MKPNTKNFNQISGLALQNPKIQKSLLGLYNGFHKARETAANETPDWEKLRDEARSIKTHTIQYLDEYLEIFERKVEDSGGIVHFAKNASDANRHVLNIAKSHNVKTVIKSKSMVSEEIGLNEKLFESDIDVVETDLGEYIIQLADETPFHIIAPAIHKDKLEVSKLFASKLGIDEIDDIQQLGAVARRQLRTKFIEADMGITGANFLVADTGTLVVVSNEGNGRMCTSMPKVHVALAGMERVIPSMSDLSTFLKLLIRSATGQRISSYVSLVNGPRKTSEEDGPDEFHLIIVDNGRSKLLENPELRESLNCIRCGACMNACPVYRKVGGHAYGYVYPGPIGAVITPVLTNLGDSKDLPGASSLCGACREVCPVKINIPRMLLSLRKDLAEGGNYPSERQSAVLERISFKLWRNISMRNHLMSIIIDSISLIQRVLFADNYIFNLPWPLSKWTKYRAIRRFPSKSFRDIWETELDNEGT